MQFKVECSNCGFTVDGSDELKSVFMDQTSIMDFQEMPSLMLKIVKRTPSSKFQNEFEAMSNALATALNTVNSPNWYCPECKANQTKSKPAVDRSV